MPECSLIYKNLYGLTKPSAELERFYHEMALRRVELPDAEIDSARLPRRVYSSRVCSRDFSLESAFEAEQEEGEGLRFSIKVCLKPNDRPGKIELSYGPGYTSMWIMRAELETQAKGGPHWLVPFLGRRAKGVTEKRYYGTDLGSVFDFIRLCVVGQ
jgi:hypothetical protein